LKICLDGSLEDEFGQRFPLLLVSFCKNQQAKACWKCCRRPTNVKEIFCLTQKISTQKSASKRYIIDLSKSVRKLKQR
jgi:hypothetical protein